MKTSNLIQSITVEHLGEELFECIAYSASEVRCNIPHEEPCRWRLEVTPIVGVNISDFPNREEFIIKIKRETSEILYGGCRCVCASETGVLNARLDTKLCFTAKTRDFIQKTNSTLGSEF